MIQTIEISTLANRADGSSNDVMRLRTFTVKEYDALIAAGFFTTNDRIELLNGAIIEKMPKGTKHALFNDLVAARFMKLLGERVYVRNQNPIWLDEISEPEPDIVLAVPPLDNYFEKHPTPAEIYLILEVSDSTLSFDRNAKSLAYARAGIKQYLLLNVNEQTVEDYREPSADGFQSKQTLRRAQSFNLVAFPEVSLAVADFLPIERQ